MKRCFRRSLLCLFPAALALVFAAFAAAAPDENASYGGVTSPALLALITDDDLFSTMDLTALLDPTGTATQHFGPFASSSPDSGTCGNDWAQDTFNREFTVHSNGDGTFTIVEQFKDGDFTTTAGPSPGACELSSPHGTLIVAGKTGSFHGYEIINDVGMQTSTDQHCNATTMTDTGCTTGTFLFTHFMCPPLGCTVSTFFFHYSAGDQSLLFHEWKNASLDRGGNSGDIASS
jgi:hypothetical protein